MVAASSGPLKRKHLPYYKDVPAAAAEYIPRNSKGYFVLITEAQTGWSTSGYNDRDGEQLSADQCAMAKRAYTIAARFIMQQHLEADKEAVVRQKITR